MRIAILSPIAWRTPPRHYGPWETIASNHAEGLVAAGHEVTLYATADSITSARLEAVCPHPYEENPEIDAKVWECLHIAHLMQNADHYDVIHNHYDFLPLTYSRLIETPMVTTIHGFSSPRIVPAYRAYNDRVACISISNADRHPDLTYLATVYNGIQSKLFSFGDGDGRAAGGGAGQSERRGGSREHHHGGREHHRAGRVREPYLLFLGRIHPDKGTSEAIDIARAVGLPIRIAGIVQDAEYFHEKIESEVDGSTVIYLGPVETAERNRLLGGALALLHPISFDEPFGLSVAEAMMCGTPVIAIRRGSMPELVLDGETGYLVDTVEEAIHAAQRLKDDPAAIDRARCREWALSRFSVEAMVQGYLAAYAKLFEGAASTTQSP